MIKFIKIEKSYILGNIEWVLGPIDLEIAQGESLAIVGRSGSGKSTLLHLAGTLSSPTKGKIEVQGQDLAKLSPKELRKFRNQKIGFVFQDFYLFPEFTLLENVEMPMKIANINKKTAKARAEKILEEVGLIERKNHLPRELSGGQRQRGAIARALVMNPEILFADEPTGNLDAETGENIIKLLKKIQKERNMSLVLATHDNKIAEICARKITLENGKIVLN